MKFVDRIDEAARLKDALAREKSSLVVMYGRRRLGKSTLIKRVLSENDVYFLADRSEGQHQRALLAKVIAQVFPDFEKLSYPDWESMFRAVNYRTDKRFTLCLDEFPYLVEQSPELPSVLQKLVDEKQLKYNLVLCGSSQNMMYGLFLDSTAPLYGRADEIMRLTPIRLPYIQEALNLNAMNAIEEYAIWGGVPRYWELRENRISLDDAMWHNILSVNGALYEEPIKLFQDDVKDIVKTSTIMSYIGTGANRLSEIAARCNEPATNLSRPLKKLVDLGFLEKDVPFGIDEKNAKKSLYKIADPFTAGQLKDIDAQIYHLGSLLADDFSLEVIKELSQKGLIAVDSQGYLREVRDTHVYPVDWTDKREALQYIHFLKVNEHEMEVLTGLSDPHEAARQLYEWGVKEVLVTLGGMGSLIFDGKDFYRIPAYKPKEVVDATGCGDTYTIGYLYQRVSGVGMEEAGRFAAAMSTLKIEKSGPFNGSKEDVIQCMTTAEQMF